MRYNIYSNIPAQAGIKIARRNINNLRYADDTTLVAESPECSLEVMTPDSFPFIKVFALKQNPSAEDCWEEFKVRNSPGMGNIFCLGLVDIPTDLWSHSRDQCQWAGTTVLMACGGEREAILSFLTPFP